MIRLNCFFQAKEGCLEAALAAAKELTAASLKQDGCIAYDVFASATRPGVLLICETWRDEAALAAMQKAAAHFVGEQDFSAFRAVGADTAPKDAVRHVMKATVTREGDVISFRVRADGFLYNMVRIMVGTLAAVAAGRMTPEDVLHALRSRDRTLAGSTAPACGLYLDRVFYND
jgi:tRNA pseudouridine(38-40) synthase